MNKQWLLLFKTIKYIAYYIGTDNNNNDNINKRLH